MQCSLFIAKRFVLSREFFSKHILGREAQKIEKTKQVSINL
jgi:hypothetical protein